MNSNTTKIVAAVVVAAVIWLFGVLTFGGHIGMISVFLSITLAGYTAGVVMDTPNPSAASKQ